MPGPDRSRRERGPLATGLLHWAVAGAAAAGSWLLLTGPRLVGPGSRVALPGRSAAPAPDDEFTTGRGSPARPPSRAAIRAGHETRDANSRRLAWIIALGLCLVLLVIGGLALMLRAFQAGDRDAALTPQQRASIVPPAPRLQDDPYADLRALRAREDALLHGHAWLGPAHDRARIPIERAMALTVGRSLDEAPANGQGNSPGDGQGVLPGGTRAVAPVPLPGDMPR